MGVYAGAKAGLGSLTKVLAKEVAPFNTRALTMTMVLTTFNTNMGKAAMLGKNSLSDDDKASVAKQMIRYISSGKIVSNGDKENFVKAVYEVVVGEGTGVGRQSRAVPPTRHGHDSLSSTVQEYSRTAGRSLGTSPITSTLINDSDCLIIPSSGPVHNSGIQPCAVHSTRQIMG
ncbi:MAG: hypothetical protein ALECFALPRED_002940 [Alectoria fallacina]|uniref:Uncharacterized protein n=1 Tax=Alectoria fallacina TaxID=1903189 RepID=A0A8H3I3Y7_9LECA|nr:MAG: hypothetical protein ALECFALPRED_002940 [Alectoria fallacina]